MNTYELRDLDEARRFLSQGLWWQQTEVPSAATVRESLEWALQVAGGGQPLPPIGFVADLGHLAFRLDWEARAHRATVSVPNLPVNLLRTYEDQVLGKIDGDWTFGRAGDALRRFQGRDRGRGLAFFLTQFRERAGFPGVEFSPGVIKHALEMPPEEVLNQGYESLRQDGPQPLLADLYEGLIAAARRAPEVLGPEDLFELEAGTALEDEGPRLARRQVLQAAASLEATLPRHRVAPAARRMEVPTRILDEDTYPVGGFTSISNRGSVESLLHSQLAYMEPDDGERPDLFDIKFLRDELLYYSRDENQFLRRRRTFVFVLQPDLVMARFKDPSLPYQRGVLLLALVVVLVRKLSEWLSTDALSFQVLFVGKSEDEALPAERELLRKLLREQLANNTAAVHAAFPPKKVAEQCREWARRSLCHCLVLSTAALAPNKYEAEDVVVSRLRVDGPRPQLAEPGEKLETVEGDEPMDSWGQALQTVLGWWV
jgi:hypothetical protein